MSERDMMPRMSVRFKSFEIRECVGLDAQRAKFEVVKWSNKTYQGKHYCWAVAFIRWNEKEPCWQFDCVGMRFIDDYEEGLCEFIQRFMKFIGTDFEGEEDAT